MRLPPALRGLPRPILEPEYLLGLRPGILLGDYL